MKIILVVRLWLLLCLSAQAAIYYGGELLAHGNEYRYAEGIGL